ncbi:DoxX family protein [Marisediminitalea aggregata]|jgi:putative oxidoreductase|uniref:DoxX family protein n=1 Tax=Marisediminitalea TaxID=2662254 RepID=UPI000C8D3405|nr:DoxX family protein [Marisediminitalea aggregata]MAP22389.1 DoxD-like family protein [Alteromonadaceae bacterium]MCP3890249.1 DoxX family protein [Desulfobulbaceae bacterium]MCP4526822.1 DoxX family protein [Aestuariibacter sp.]MCP4862891.1 DoxX family protein [Alteromonas sp.]MCP9480026.1 DoxX family protein [Marisediminitalea aggregata]|tara:strand:+ start:2825 stop:3280 length:456 start_codon:yes stop_codon:yes gene_type:complete
MNTTLLTSLFTSNAGLSALVLRVPVGIVLAAHGAQKLFAWFGGYGLEGTGQYMESIGLAPGFLMALLAGSAEFFGGLALVLGVLTRPAALVSAFTMLMAIFTAHISNGLFLSNGGYEYALALFAATLSLVFSGAGRLAVDNLIANKFASAQ